MNDIKIDEKLRSIIEGPYREFPLLYASGAAKIGKDRWPRIRQCCELALLWSLQRKADFLSSAAKLAGWLIPIIEEKFFALWTCETEYQADAVVQACSLLLKACGRDVEVSPKLPLHQYLFSQNVSIIPEFGASEDREIGYWLSRADIGAVALTLCGRKCGMGAIRIGEIEIASFGPQTGSLNETSSFGIQTNYSTDGWCCPVGAKEVWFQIRPEVQQNCIHFRWNQVGIDPKKKMYLNFYVLADECRLDFKSFKPRSLAKFSGRADSIVFRRVGELAAFQASWPIEVDLIPLAGEGCFWGASFLLAVALPPYDGNFVFQWVAK